MKQLMALLVLAVMISATSHAFAADSKDHFWFHKDTSKCHWGGWVKWGQCKHRTAGDRLQLGK